MTIPNRDPISRDMRAVIAGIAEAHANARDPKVKLGVRMSARRISRSVWPLRSQEPLRMRFWRECFGTHGEPLEPVRPELPTDAQIAEIAERLKLAGEIHDRIKAQAVKP